MRRLLLTVSIAAAMGACTSQAGVPPSALPQGGSASARPTTAAPAPAGPDARLNPAVTQATVRTTICVSGFTATIRPPAATTTAIKRTQIAAYGYADTALADYEEDHVVSLELGGAAAASINLYPEPHSVSVADDKEENSLHAQVCSGTISLADARAKILATKVAHGYRADVSAAAR